MRLLDGEGNGPWAGVDSNHRLKVISVQETVDRNVNRIDHKVWSLPFEGIDPVGADDYFVYIRNTGTKDLAVTDVRVESTVAGVVEVHHVSGTAVHTAGVDISPVNRYLGGSATPTATIKTDTDVTGLTNEGVIFWINCPVVDTLYHLSTSSNIIIAPGQAMALMWDTATGILSGVVSLVELP